MHIHTTLLATACALALVACGDKSPDTTDTTVDPAATTEPAAPAPTVAPGSDKPAAVVTDCATVIEGSDAMQYNVGSISVPASCSEFTITLEHTGTMAVTVMGHNVVISTAADMQAVAATGMGAGAEASYVKPGDTRVIAHSDLVGGGESTSITFPVASIQGAGPYVFFCSFPGHYPIMHGTIAVE